MQNFTGGSFEISFTKKAPHHRTTTGCYQKKWNEKKLLQDEFFI